MKTAWEYLRYSSLNQDDYTIQNQHDYNIKWAENNQVTIIRSYTDEAKSASVYAKEERPDFERLIQAVERGDRVDFILFFVVDRFARNDWDFARLKHAIEQKGDMIQIVYTGQFIPEGAEGMLLEGVLQKYAIFQSQHLSKIVKGGMKTNQSKALHTGGTPILGYSLVDSDPAKPGKHKKFVVNDQEAPAAVCIFREMATAWNCSRAAKIANESGYRKRNGKPFSANDIWYLVRNPKYWGRYEAGRYTRDGVTVTQDGALPVFIPREYLDAVEKQIQVKDGVTVAKTREGGQIWILTGKLVCGECGKAYSGDSWLGGNTGKSRTSVYRCGGQKKKLCTNKPIQKKMIEEFVLDKIWGLFSPVDQEAVIDRVMEKYQEKIKGSVEDTTKLSKELTETDKKIGRLLSSIENGIPAETVADRIRELTACKKDLEERLRKAQNTPTGLTREMVRIHLNENQHLLTDRSDLTRCKKLVQDYIDRIVIYPDEIEVFYKFDGGHVKTPRAGGPGVKDLVDQVEVFMVDLRVSQTYPRPARVGRGIKKKAIWVKK